MGRQAGSAQQHGEWTGNKLGLPGQRNKALTSVEPYHPRLHEASEDGFTQREAGCSTGDKPYPAPLWPHHAPGVVTAAAPAEYGCFVLRLDIGAGICTLLKK